MTARCPTRSRTFVPVKTVTVRISADCRLSIYLRNDRSGQYKLYCGAGTTLEASDVTRLYDSGITTVYLDRCEYSRFQEHLRSTLKSVVDDHSLSVSQRLCVVNEVVRDVLLEAFRWGNVSRAVEETTRLADHVVDLIGSAKFVASELSRVLYYDYSTFTHSANVGFYSILLAKSLGYTDRGILKRIGTGALLHDIGKVDVPEHIITKRGPLSSAEMELMKQHTSLGLLRLRDLTQVDFAQLMMVYQHHERLDGTGYPVRLPAEDIHESARICASPTCSRL